MAYLNGTATSNIDLWNELLTFLTEDTVLVGDGQEWEEVWSEGNSVVLRGPGSAGDDNIYVGLSRTDSIDTDANFITIFGMTGVNSAATEMSGHVNVSQGVRIWLDGGAMRFWIAASGRRFILAVNISTVYQTAYAGLFLPYAPPTVYPYPLFIGGCASLSTKTTSWRSTSDYHASFAQAPVDTSVALGRYNAYMLAPDAMWLGAAANTSADICLGPNRYTVTDADGTDPFRLETSAAVSPDVTGYLPIQERIMRGYGDVYTLDPITLIQTSPDIQHHGTLDGFFVCPGVGNAAENVIEVDGVDHLVLQNVFRTSTVDYMAMKLE